MKVEWPKEHSLTSGQFLGQCHTTDSTGSWWAQSSMNRREAGLENWPDLWITQLQPAAEHPAAPQPGRKDSRGHPRAPNTHQQPGSWGRAHPQQNGMGSESGGEQGREGPHREWQHFHKHKQARISPRMGPKQSSSGPGQESKAVPQGRRAPIPPSTGWGGLAQHQPCGKGTCTPSCWDKHRREQKPAGRGWSLPGQTLARPHCTHLVPRWGPHFSRSLRQRERGLFSLAHRRLGTSESCLELHQDGSCKDSADKCFQLRQTGQGRAMAQKAPWNIQAGHNDNLFHSKVVKSSHRFHMEAMGLLFLGVFMASGVKAMTYLTQGYFYPALNEWLGQRPPEASSLHLQRHNLINSCDILPATIALIM